MTAEIAILNKEAVVLAADSTATAPIPGGSSRYEDKVKTFTVDKLFSLGPQHAVGIMAYESGLFMGIPWETIIKVYRETLPREKKKYLKDYAEDFLQFLQEDRLKMIPETHRDDYYKHLITGFYYYIRQDLIQEYEDKIEEGNSPINLNSIRTITHDYIERLYAWMDKCDDLPRVDIKKEDFAGHLQKHYKYVNKEATEKIFENMNSAILTESHKSMLNKCASYLFTKNTTDTEFSSVARTDELVASSGIVIAGFGDLDIFPSIKSYTVFGLFGSYLNYTVEEDDSISFENGSLIVPFAQRDIIDRFIEGLDEECKNTIINSIMAAFFSADGKKYPKDSDYYRLSKLISELSPIVKDKLESSLYNVMWDIFNRYSAILGADIHQVVEFLPKQELALLAENLIGTTALARRVSNSQESVGWPIDVAIISKGDGFIWAKKKRYYDIEQNSMANSIITEVYDAKR